VVLDPDYFIKIQPGDRSWKDNSVHELRYDSEDPIAKPDRRIVGFSLNNT
tara:strand:+ start:2357 stop:2506 length:150 start_codon:yes stop_codon:yes gene_type:complete